tara:strand:- start:661 stop:1416 length:756 start_codon:yes stop_codon:yes gene_type:complete
MSEIREIKGKDASSYEDLLDKMFADVEAPNALSVELPSKSRFYNNAGEIIVTPLTFEEEQRILNSKGKGTDVINLILTNCVKGVNIPDLMQMDKLFLLLKVREVSYGSVYKFNLACPSCGEEIRTEIDVANDLKVNYVPEEFEDPHVIDLPKLGVEVVVRLPRNREESYFATSESLAKNLYRFVVSLGGQTDSVFISKAIKRMHIIDVKTIANEVTKGEFGLDPRFMFECPSCGHNAMMEIPLDASFFSVT